MEFNQGGQSVGPSPKMHKSMVWLLALSGVVIVVLSAVFGYAMGKQRSAQKSASSSATPPARTTNAPAEEPTIKVVWVKPVKTASLQLFIPEFSRQDSLNSEETVTYYKVGTMTSPAGEATLVFAYGNNTPGLDYDAASVFLFAVYPKKISLLKKYSWIQDTTEPVDHAGLLRSKFDIDSETVIPDLEFPNTITGPKPRQVLEYRDTRNFLDLGKPTQAAVFQDPVWGTVYASSAANKFLVSKSSLFTGLYTLKVDFFDKDDLVPQITWNDGTKNTTEYGYTSFGGCGMTNDIVVVPPGEIQIEKDLRQVGKNNQGDPIYELKDPNSKYLKKVYEIYPTDPKLTYAEFLATRPLLYWVDPFGRLVELQNKKFQPQAECGKPVIYLYPEKTTQVSVQLELKGGFTYSEPAYRQGWEVIAEPNGKLTELQSGKTYPYLFWEGRGGLYHRPEQGFVVKQTDVSNFLDRTLAQFGLNPQEIADFKEFWLPRMQEKPYYFITFIGNRGMDALAPLKIDPKPDTIIRVLMDFTPLDQPIKVQPFRIHTPERKGFTVVEWGGVLQ